MLDVGFADEANHDIKLLQLDVNGVVVFDEEDLDVVGEDFGTLLHNEINVAESNILDLGLRGEKGDCIEI